MMSDKEDQLPISHLNNNPANARELLRWDFCFIIMCTKSHKKEHNTPYSDVHDA